MKASDSGRSAEAGLFPFSLAMRGSFRRQIVLTFVVGFFLLIAAFVAYLLQAESDYLYRDNNDETASLAESLAASSASWVLANDVAGLQEVVFSFKSHPELRYAMVISPAGRVLAHSDATKEGQFVSDERSLALIKSPSGKRVVIDDESIVDVAVPVMVDHRQIAWARIAQGRERIVGNLRRMILSSALFVLLSVILSLFAAIFIANRLGYHIGSLVKVAKEVRAGNFTTRAQVSGADEFSILGASLNQMLDALAQDEVALRESEDRYRLLVESAPMCIHEVGMDGRISSMNRAGLAMMGVEEECKVRGFLYLDAVCDADRERIGELLAKAYTGEASYFEFKASGPGELIFKSCFVPIKNPDGSVKKLMGITEDVTERKQAEAALREKEERLALATLKNGVGVWDWNLQTQQMIWDDSMFALYHIRREDFIGTEEAWRASLHPDDLTRGDQEVADAIADKKPFETEFRVIWPNGEIHHIKAVAKVFRDERGTPLRMLGINMDITARKQAEEELHRLNAELEQRVTERTAQLEAANKELESFSYSVSHDLRTPLRAIDGFSRILLDDYTGKLDDEGKRLLNVVRDNASYMGQLIDDILKFSRTSRLEMALSEIDMESMARSGFAELQPAVDHGKLQLDIEHLPPAMGDHAMLHQVFVNLLSNAIKFSRSRETQKIKVGGSIEGGEAIYFVQDNGAGFDMQYVDKLFNVFQRLHTVNEFEGTGIGLAIVKRIITKHGGRVWAEAKAGEGATFYFALPIRGK